MIARGTALAKETALKCESTLFLIITVNDKGLHLAKADAGTHLPAYVPACRNTVVGVPERLSPQEAFTAPRLHAARVCWSTAKILIVGGDDFLSQPSLEKRKMPPRRLLRSITSLVLLVSLGAAPLVFRSSEAKAAGGKVAATPVDKVSPELRQLIQSGQGAHREVDCAIDFTSTTSGGLLGGIVGSLVQTVGRLVQGLLRPSTSR